MGAPKTAAQSSSAKQGISRAVMAGAGRVAVSGAELPPLGPTSPSVERMLLVALRLFAERGFHGTSVRDIASELGVKPASLYSLVESKEQLLADLVRIGHNAHTTTIEQSMAAAPDSAAEQLVAFVVAHVRFHARWQMLAVVINTELHCLSPALAAPSLELRERAAQALRAAVDQGIADGEFDLKEAFFATTAIAAMGMRVATWFDPGQGHTIDEVAAEYSILALRMVAAKSHRRSARGSA